MNCADEDEALRIRHNFSQTFQLQISSVIEKVCTKFVPGKEWIQIDKIEVDMGEMSPVEFNNDFEKIFLYRFEKELLAKLSGFSNGERDNGIHQSMLELLKCFLLKGVLPWWAVESETDLDKVCDDVFENSGKLMEQFFLQQKNNPVVWKRAAFQLSDKAIAKIILLLAPLAQAKKVTNEMLAWLVKEISGLQHEQKAAVLQVLQRKFKEINSLVVENAPLFFEVANNPGQVNTSGASLIFRGFKNNPAEFELIKKELSIYLARIQVWPAGAVVMEENAASLDPAANDSGGMYLAGDNIIFSETTSGKTNLDQELIEVEKYMAKHTGIILLAPFLHSFFSRLQLLDADQWVNDEAQVRAVYLLKYLADGEKKHPEFQLVLEKLLCGIPLDQPLEAAPEFLQSETDEAEALLQSVLEHWKQLKNTSVSGLRESFFKRDGIISAKENNWLLQVERKTLDILLDSIPWGFSTVSLPWNGYLIFTEW
jgi:hypothetical protein